MTFINKILTSLQIIYQVTIFHLQLKIKSWYTATQSCINRASLISLLLLRWWSHLN